MKVCTTTTQHGARLREDSEEVLLIPALLVPFSWLSLLH